MSIQDTGLRDPMETQEGPPEGRVHIHSVRLPRWEKRKKFCALCSEPVPGDPKGQRCRKCHSVFYCSKKCRVQDARETHKYIECPVYRILRKRGEPGTLMHDFRHTMNPDVRDRVRLCLRMVSKLYGITRGSESAGRKLPPRSEQATAFETYLQKLLVLCGPLAPNRVLRLELEPVRNWTAWADQMVRREEVFADLMVALDYLPVRGVGE